MNLGNAIKDFRLKKGYKQVELATMCNLSQSYLSSIEKGRKEPTISVLKDIASVLSIPVPVLIFFSLDQDDIEESKKETFKLVEPTIKDLISNTLLKDQIK